MTIKAVLGAITLALLLGCGTDTTTNQVGNRPVSTLNYYEQGQVDSLAVVVAQQVSQAKTPVLYFYADWCGPCRRFRETLTDAQVQDALAAATLIKINIDEDTQGLAAQYGIQAVPTFVKVDARLTPLAIISGDEWEEDVPANIAPVMHRLVATRTYDQVPPAASAQ